MVLKLLFSCRHNISLPDSEGADQPKERLLPMMKLVKLINLKRKKMISTPLMMENPVRSPMVPPMRLSWASILIFLSLSMSSKVAVSK